MDFVVGWIADDEVKAFYLVFERPTDGIGAGYFDLVLDVQLGDVLVDGATGGFVDIDGGGVGGATADGLQAERTATGESVQNRQASDITQHIKNRPPYLVRHRMRPMPRRRLKFPSP